MSPSGKIKLSNFYYKIIKNQFQINNLLEDADSTKKLTETLMTVRPASIARWNEHKDVKEDKERDPCIFIPHDKSSDVDPKRIQSQKKKVVAPGGVSSILQSATMVVNMAVKGFKKSDKPSVSISEKVSIADPSI